MPSPLELDWKRVQAGDPPPWCKDLLWCEEYFPTAADHYRACSKWLHSTGAWVEPPGAHRVYWWLQGSITRRLDATDSYTATYEACTRREKELKQ